MTPTPFTTLGPPLWRGGISTAAIPHAATELDGWCPFEVDDEQKRSPSRRCAGSSPFCRRRWNATVAPGLSSYVW